MPVVSCPRCGKPTWVSLATPDFLSCVACAYRGQPPRESVGPLHEAAAAVFRSPIAARQLSDSVRRALGSSGFYGRRFTLLAAATTSPFVLAELLFYVGDRSANGDSNIVLNAFMLGTLGGVVLLCAVGRALIRKRQRAMEDACAARPPDVEGEPASCHVCGAPITEHAEAFVRCAFCGADNLVSPRVLQRVRGVLSPWYGSQVQAVELALARMRSASEGMMVRIIAGAFLVPTLLFFGTIIGMLIAARLQIRPDLGRRYAAVDTTAGRCIGHVVMERDQQARVYFGLWHPPGFPPSQLVPRSSVEPFAPSALIGKTVVTYDGRVGDIAVVRGHALFGNAVSFVGLPPEAMGAPITGLCFPGPQ